jgi:hypothetical protein
MRPGYGVYTGRSASFSAHTSAATAAKIMHLIAGRTRAFVVAIFFVVVLTAQAQESVQEVALPPWSEPTLPSMEPALSTQAAPIPSVAEQLPSTLAEPLPTSTEPLPSSEEAFPSSPDPWLLRRATLQRKQVLCRRQRQEGLTVASARRMLP